MYETKCSRLGGLPTWHCWLRRTQCWLYHHLLWPAVGNNEAGTLKQCFLVSTVACPCLFPKGVAALHVSNDPTVEASGPNNRLCSILQLPLQPSRTALEVCYHPNVTKFHAPKNYWNLTLSYIVILTLSSLSDVLKKPIAIPSHATPWVPPLVAPRTKFKSVRVGKTKSQTSKDLDHGWGPKKISKRWGGVGMGLERMGLGGSIDLGCPHG